MNLKRGIAAVGIVLTLGVGAAACNNSGDSMSKYCEKQWHDNQATLQGVDHASYIKTCEDPSNFGR